MAHQLSKRKIAVVTGSRAEFGLLAPVMRAVREQPSLELMVIAAGSHYVGPALTYRDVEAAFPVCATVPMQDATDSRGGAGGGLGRAADAMALGRGVCGFASIFEKLVPDWVVVLGDRIEAFAAASAAAVVGIPLAHIHGGDRAEGIADESMRHAITKLAHLHLAATHQSALRLMQMGERAETVRVVGSPAIDGLSDIGPMSDAEASELGDPRVVLLLHPSGLSKEGEEVLARGTARAVETVAGRRVLWLAPNQDAGRAVVVEAVVQVAESAGWTRREHLSRPAFVALLRRLAATRGVLVGNSSAGLIEAAAVGVATVNIGPRQAGRERAGNVVEVCESRIGELGAVLKRAMEGSVSLGRAVHPYGDGHAGERIAAVLAECRQERGELIRKRCTY